MADQIQLMHRLNGGPPDKVPALHCSPRHREPLEGVPPLLDKEKEGAKLEGKSIPSCASAQQVKKKGAASLRTLATPHEVSLTHKKIPSNAS